MFVDWLGSFFRTRVLGFLSCYSGLCENIDSCLGTYSFYVVVFCVGLGCYVVCIVCWVILVV